MAELREIQVVITQEETKPNDNKPKAPNNKVEKQKQTDAIGSIVMHKAYDIVKEDVKRVASYEIQKWTNLNDDYIAQRNLTTATNVISRAKSSATAIIGASMVNPVLGVVVAIGQIATLAIDIWQNYDQQNILLRQLDANLSFNRVRAGFSLTSNSIGDNR